MRVARTGLIISTVGVLGLFVLQFWLVYRAPSWGWNNPFPFTILRSVEMPILIAISASVAAFLTESMTQRQILYWIIAGSAVEIVAVEAMVSLSQPVLVLPVLLLNALIAIQFIRYAVELFAVK